MALAGLFVANMKYKILLFNNNKKGTKRKLKATGKKKTVI